MKINLTTPRTILTGILISLTSFLYSCGDVKEITEKTDLEKMNLKGDVIGLDDGNHFIIFNTIGNVEKRIYYSEDVVGETSNYIYFENKLEKIIMKGQSNDHDRITFCTYDSNNRLSKQSTENDRIVENNFFFYDNNGIPTKDSLVSFDKANPDKAAVNIINHYYIDGILVGQEGDFIGYKTKTTYKDGLESKVFIGDKTYTYNYTYDLRNNWIQKKCIEDGEIYSNRKVFYKGDDISKYEKMYNDFQATKSSNSSSSIDKNVGVSNNSISDNSSNSSNNTQTPQQKCYSCNGTGKCGKCSKTFSKPFYKGNGNYEWRNESRLGLLMCNDCHGRGHEQLKRSAGGWEPGKDCYVRQCNDGWVACRDCNYDGNGKSLGQCQKCKGSGK